MKTETDTLIDCLTFLFNDITMQQKETCLSCIVCHYVIQSIPHLVISHQFTYFPQDFVVFMYVCLCMCVEAWDIQDLKS